MDTVQPLPVEVTDIYWAQAPSPQADVTAEAEVVQDLGDDPRLILRLSAQFFRLTPSSRLVTLLYETIHMRLELTWKRLQQADDLSRGHFQGTTRSEQAFETQRIQLARRVYLFPDEVMAEKHLQHDYPTFAADRLGRYHDIQEQAWENRDYEVAEPGLEWPVALWFWFRHKLGALMATTDTLGSGFGDRAAFFDARLRDLLPGDHYRRVTGFSQWGPTLRRWMRRPQESCSGWSSTSRIRGRLVEIGLTDPQDVGLESRREPAYWVSS